MKLNVLLLCLSCVALNAQNYQLKGLVIDDQTREPLVGVSILVLETETGTSTGDQGNYELNLPSGKYQIEFSYLGYEKDTLLVNLFRNLNKDVKLEAGATTLDNVIVEASLKDQNASSVRLGTNQLLLETIKKLPSLLGEVEIIRSIQLLPGVTTVGEGASGFNVRGGGTDQNLSLLDEAPIYNVSHLLGFFSVFNPDAAKAVTLYKGNIPASHGGRISSVLDVELKEGNKERIELNGGVGLIFSRLSVEGPLVKDKSSFIVAGRRSYIDVLAQPFLGEDARGSKLNFYDLTFKLSHKLTKKDQVLVSGYLGRDNFGVGEQACFSWGNKTSTLRWNHLFNDNLSSSLIAYYSFYDYSLDFGQNDELNSFDWSGNISNYSVHSKFSYYFNSNSLLRFGGQFIRHEIQPGIASAVSEGETVDLSLTKKLAHENAVYIENELKLGNRLNLNYGLRLSHFNYIGSGITYEFEATNFLDQSRPPISGEEYGAGESIQTYSNLEPRIALKYMMGKNASIRASYNYGAQYIHLISNTTASMPIDVWTVSSSNVPPQTAAQFTLGYFKKFGNDHLETSLELYHKKMGNQIEYASDADLILNEFIEGSILIGEGKAYGLEFHARKNKGRLTGWLSYSLSKTERLVEGINNNKWFPARFDQRHNLSLAAFYKMNDRWSVGTNFIYNSGNPTTLPNARFEQQGYVVPYDLTESRNNARLPAYHRLDISFTLEGKENKYRRWKDQWVFSIYNLYDRHNTFDIFLRQQKSRPLPGQGIGTEATRFSVIGSIIPAVSYNFKF